MTRNTWPSSVRVLRHLFPSSLKWVLPTLVYGLLLLSRGGCEREIDKIANEELQPKRELNMCEALRQNYVVSRGKTQEEWQRDKEQWLAHLRERYRRIDVNTRLPDAAEHAVRFGQLMREWNPIRCSVDDLKSIAGPPARETPEVLDYYFEAPAPPVWRFKVEDNLIMGVEYFHGE